MRYLIVVSLFSLFVVLPVRGALSETLEPVSQLKANEYEHRRTHADWIETTFGVTAGYRTDTLKWNIAGNLQGIDPNILSELSWNDIDIFQLGLTNRTVIRERVYIRGYLYYGIVADGSNRDSDYNGDNRTEEFSRTMNGVDGNDVWDGSIGIGPRFSFYDSAITVCPLAGYAISEQDYNIVDGNQVISEPPSTMPIGPIDNLDSRYQARWTGPWIGVDLLLSIPYKQGSLSAVVVRISGEYHFIDYSAKANWNLRSDFSHPVSFTHEAEGAGFMASASILWELRNRLGIHAGIGFREMIADDGVDRTFYADGTTGDTRFNEVSWRAVTLEAGVSYDF